MTISIDAVQFVPIDNGVAVQSVQLPGDFHPGPADRMITALARHYSAMLVTSEEVHGPRGRDAR